MSEKGAPMAEGIEDARLGTLEEENSGLRQCVEDLRARIVELTAQAESQKQIRKDLAANGNRIIADLEAQVEVALKYGGHGLVEKWVDGHVVEDICGRCGESRDHVVHAGHHTTYPW